MPGPPMPAIFTYDGTPGMPPRSDKFNTLDREMVQTQRFFNGPESGTHSRVPLRTNIPNNSDKGVGVSTGGVIQTNQTKEQTPDVEV